MEMDYREEAYKSVVEYFKKTASVGGSDEQTLDAIFALVATTLEMYFVSVRGITADAGLAEITKFARECAERYIQKRAQEKQADTL